MQAPTQLTAKHLWLPLLVIFVLCAGISDPVLRADSLLPEIELEVGGERSSSEGGNAITGFPVESLVDQFLSVSCLWRIVIQAAAGS